MTTDRLPPGSKRSFADKLNELFDTVRGPGQKPFTNKEVAAAVNARAAVHGGTTLDTSYLGKLRKEQRANPSFEVVEALAAFFGVAVNFFSEEDAPARRDDEQLALQAAMRDSGVRRLAKRADGVSPGSLEMVTAMLEKLRELEGLKSDSAGQTGE